VITIRVSGVKAHDARLVAVMKTNGISQILTFNVADFSRFPEIEAIHPDKVLPVQGTQEKTDAT
jgi:predicted nucleic acid-binding protein